MANVQTSNLQQIVAALRTPAQQDPNANKIAVAKSFIKQSTPASIAKTALPQQTASTFASKKA